MSDFTTIPKDKYDRMVTHLKSIVYSSISDDTDYANFAWEKARHILCDILGVKYEEKVPVDRDISNLFEEEN